ncbi:MAG: PIN domain-containing protein [Candidatus Bipolaricaulia bacterium]
MAGYLLDTNHASKVMAGDENLRRHLENSRETGSKFGISMTVLGELYFAVFASQRKNENLNHLRAFLDSILLLKYDEKAAKEFGKIQSEQKSKGRPIPPTDAQIAAVARIQNLTILSEDKHFTYIDVPVENWLTS